MSNLPIYSTFLLLLVSSRLAQSQETLDCSKIVKIHSQGLLSYLATVTFSSPSPSTAEGDALWALEMKTDHPFTFLGVWNAWVSTEPSQGKIQVKSRDSSNNLDPLNVGEPITYRFRISWGRGSSIPKVVSLKWNGKDELCTQS